MRLPENTSRSEEIMSWKTRIADNLGKAHAPYRPWFTLMDWMCQLGGTEQVHLGPLELGPKTCQEGRILFFGLLVV